jgi:tetratricopeptide (TPR) repeat protein
MKPFARASIRCIHCALFSPCPVIRPQLLPAPFHRPLSNTVLKHNQNPRTRNTSNASKPTHTSESTVSEVGASSSTDPQNINPSPRAYKSKEDKWTYSPITSQDWEQIESKIDPVPEADWSESDSPVPLNRDFPITQADFAQLSPEEKKRLRDEERRRIQLETIRKTRMYDHKHLHPSDELFQMPMVAPYMGYAPEGNEPPSKKEVPWQMRSPWRWIRPVSLTLLIGSLFVGAAVYLARHREEYQLKALEVAAPAPEDWSLKARHYYALSLKHKNAGEFQHAVWALQRALVEAGYRWVMEPQNIPLLERKPLDLENAKIIRQLLLWEINLEHWDNALELMPAVASAFHEETPENHARRSDLLRIMAFPTEKVHGVDAAATMFKDALGYLNFTLPKRRKEVIVLSEDMAENRQLLRTLDEYVVYQLRNGVKKPKEVLPTLVSIARVYHNTPFHLRDLCSEGLVLLHIGEIMYASGKHEESLNWTTRALEGAKLGMTNRLSAEEDRERCTECLGMGSVSLGVLYEVPFFFPSSDS